MTTQNIVPEPLSKVKLSKYDPGYHANYDKQSARRHLPDIQKRMRELQEMLYAQGEKSLLVVLQAMDAGGKDSTIKRVFEGVNPQGVRVSSFKAPSKEELDHDFLWRIHHHTPPKGFIGIFNRSHYEDVLIVRVNGLVPDEVWKARYDHINNFERLLYYNGTHILKFFLHISKAEQKERFEERLTRPDKHWKFSRGDLPVRERWEDYMRAYEDVLTKTNTEYAPWHIVPANRKWYRNVVVTKAIVDKLESMGLAYPEAEPNLDEVIIPD